MTTENEKRKMFLNLEECRIIKTIRIIEEKNKKTYTGDIIYSRLFSDTYRIIDTTLSQMERCINDYPKQEDFPNDYLDFIIQNSINEIYPNIRINNLLYVSTVDKDTIDRLKHKPVKPVSINFSPNIPIDDYWKYEGSNFSELKINLPMYTADSEHEFTQLYNVPYDLDKKDELKKLLKTIQSI